MKVMKHVSLLPYICPRYQFEPTVPSCIHNHPHTNFISDGLARGTSAGAISSQRPSVVDGLRTVALKLEFGVSRNQIFERTVAVHFTDPFHVSTRVADKGSDGALLLQFTISFGIITICTMATLFKYIDKSLVSCIIGAIMLSFLIYTFFTQEKSTVAVGTLDFLGAFFPYYILNDEAVSMFLKILASLLSPTSFAFGSVNIMSLHMLAYVGATFGGRTVKNIPKYAQAQFYIDNVLPRIKEKKIMGLEAFCRSTWL